MIDRRPALLTAPDSAPDLEPHPWKPLPNVPTTETSFLMRWRPPSWPPAANLTNGPDGLAGWTYDDFLRAMREGRSKDGRPLLPPMAGMPAVAAKMTDVELQAMWAYLSTLPARPDGT